MVPSSLSDHHAGVSALVTHCPPIHLYQPTVWAKPSAGSPLTRSKLATTLAYMITSLCPSPCERCEPVGLMCGHPDDYRQAEWRRSTYLLTDVTGPGKAAEQEKP